MSFNISFINVANIQPALGERAWSYQLFLRHMPQVWTQIIRAVPNFHSCQIQMAVGMFLFRYGIKFSSLYLPCHFPIPSSSGAAQPLLLQSAVSTKGLRRQKHWAWMLHMAWILWVVPWRAWVFSWCLWMLVETSCRDLMLPSPTHHSFNKYPLMSTTRQLLRKALVVTKNSKGFTPMGGFLGNWSLKEEWGNWISRKTMPHSSRLWVKVKSKYMKIIPIMWFS